MVETCTDYGDEAPADPESKSKVISELNDRFRLTLQGGKFFITRGVQALEQAVIDQAVALMRTFSDFTEDNDPHGEHDFGGFSCGDVKFFWKIDYYNQELRGHSEDATDPEVTTRVLTLMLREEY